MVRPLTRIEKIKELAITEVTDAADRSAAITEPPNKMVDCTNTFIRAAATFLCDVADNIPTGISNENIAHAVAHKIVMMLRSTIS